MVTTNNTVTCTHRPIIGPWQWGEECGETFIPKPGAEYELFNGCVEYVCEEHIQKERGVCNNCHKECSHCICDDDGQIMGPGFEPIYITQPAVNYHDIVRDNYWKVKYVPEEILDEEFCEWIMSWCEHKDIIVYFPDHKVTKEMCIEAIKYRPGSIFDIPASFKTEDMWDLYYASAPKLQ